MKRVAISTLGEVRARLLRIIYDTKIYRDVWDDHMTANVIQKLEWLVRHLNSEYESESNIMREDWRKAPGVKAKKGETNSAFAERDYSIKCKTHYMITAVKGYWIWWCSAHHQPRCWCDLGREKTKGKGR